MKVMVSQPFAICCAWALDAVIGDPQSMPHPVSLIGKSIQVMETWSRRWFVNKKIAGIFVGLCVPLAVFFVTLLMVRVAISISPYLGTLVSICIVYACLSTRCLGDEALSILKKLLAGDITESRRRLSQIVGRDTEQLSRDRIVCAVVETVSESTVDGIISPLFYAFLGGAPLAMAYKAVNTLDSMVGYKDERYFEFGWFSARLDDIANYIPARMCLVLIPVAALFLCPTRAVKVFKTGIRDGRKSPSPNAGFPEACFAAALGIQLGGECSYHGVVSRKPVLGDWERENEAKDIARAVRLMWLSSGLSLAFFAGVSIIIGGSC
jgi:adenosylcobinamide-phosphate synthase